MVVPVFCHCHLPGEGNMIECCQCSEWYHEKCENIDKQYGKRKRLIGCVKDALVVDISKGEIKKHFYYRAYSGGVSFIGYHR